MGDQLVAMKIDRENLERLFTEWPYIKGMSEFVYQLVYVSSRGETVYLLSTNGNNPFSGSDLKGRIITDRTSGSSTPTGCQRMACSGFRCTGELNVATRGRATHPQVIRSHVLRLRGTVAPWDGG